MKKTFRRFNVKGVYIFNYILFSLYLFVSLSAVFTQNVLSIWFYLFQFISPSRTSNFALIILQSLYPWPSILKPSSSKCYHLYLGILTLSLFLHITCVCFYVPIVFVCLAFLLFSSYLFTHNYGMSSRTSCFLLPPSKRFPRHSHSHSLLFLSLSSFLKSSSPFLSASLYSFLIILMSQSIFVNPSFSFSISLSLSSSSLPFSLSLSI